MERKLNGRTPFIFSAVTGVVGWAVLAFFTGVDAPFTVSLELSPTFFIFLALGLATRILAFRIFHSIHISLDSPFYIASILSLGAVPAAWVIALSLSIDTLRRLIQREWIAKSERRPLAANVGQFLLNGGSTGALILAVAAMFNTDAIRASLISGQGSELTVLWVVPALSLAFLALHYPVTGLSLWLQGFSAGDIMKRVVMYGIGAEAALIPLSVVVVLVNNPARPLSLILLGATLILVNLIFKRMSEAGDSLRQRIAELETLNAVGRVLSSSLELPQLIERVARETFAVTPRASHFTIALWNDRDHLFDVIEYRRGVAQFESRKAPRGTGLLMRVVEERKPVLIADARREREGADTAATPPHEARVTSWMGAPLIVYDEVVGVISVECGQPRAFDNAQLRVLSAIALETAVAVQNAQLYELATVDGLTRLYVRRYFDQRLADEWRRSRRYNTQFAVILLDLDDFKRVNDEFGHPVGDKVLREVARVVRRNLRGIDIAARYGGEEFAVILPRTTIHQAAKVAERIRLDVAKERIRAGGYTVSVTTSIGVAGFPDVGQKDASQLVEKADLALYRAKRNGKNNVDLFVNDEAQLRGRRPGPRQRPDVAPAAPDEPPTPSIVPPPASA